MISHRTARFLLTKINTLFKKEEDSDSGKLLFLLTGKKRYDFGLPFLKTPPAGDPVGGG